MAKLTQPAWKEYDNFFKTGNMTTNDLWTIYIQNEATANYNSGSIRCYANGTYQTTRTARATTKVDLRSLGNNFFFTISAESYCPDQSSRSASATAKIGDTTLFSIGTGQNQRQGLGMAVWIKITGNNMNIKLNAFSQGSGSSSVLANDTNVDISALDSLDLMIQGSGSVSNNIVSGAVGHVLLNPILFSKEKIGSNKTE